MIDHVFLFPNVFEVLTGRGQLWASAAEGFFVISGLLVGYIYGPRMLAHGQRSVRAVTAKIWKRAAVLYGVSVALTLLFTWAGNHLLNPATVKPGLWRYPQFGRLLGSTLSMQYTYGWADFLNHYVIFMLFAPLAVYACAKGRGRLVVAVSALVYAVHGGSFNGGWQLLFMGGLVAGYYLPRLESWARSLSVQRQQVYKNALLGGALVTVLTSMALVHGSSFILQRPALAAQLPALFRSLAVTLGSWNDWLRPFYDKNTLGPLRVAMDALWLGALYVVFRSYEQKIEVSTRGALRRLGEASLVVYGVHAVVMYWLFVYLPAPNNYWRNTVVTLAFGAAVYAVVVARKPAKLWLTRRRKLLVQLPVRLRVAYNNDLKA